MDLEQRHPDWMRLERRWLMARAFWMGGTYVLNPDFPASIGGKWIETQGGGEQTPDAVGSDNAFRWIASEYNSFLWRHERETDAEYDMRQERIINPPLFQYLVNTLSAGVLRTKPTREIVSGIWKQIHEDIDALGTDVDAWMRRALAMALVYGRVHSVVDRPALGEAVSRGEQIARGERAYAYLVSPLDVVDWSTDDRGAFRWVVIREDSPDDRGPGTKAAAPKNQYRVRYPDHWELWVETDPQTRMNRGEKWRMASTGPLPGIGVSTFFATRSDQPASMAIETPLADFLDGNRYVLNKFSELDEIDRTQTFSQMAIPTVDGVVGVVGIGPRRYIGYPSEAGAPTFISPDASLPEGKYARLADFLHMLRQLAGVGRGKAEYSKEERSAAALTVESEDKRNQLAWWSKALNEFDHGVHSDLALWEGSATWPKATYPTNYDVKALMTQIAEAVQLVAGVPLMQTALEAQRAIVTPIVRKMLGDGGVDDVEVEKTLAGLVTAIKDAEEAKRKETEAKAEAFKGPGKPFGGNEDQKEPANGAS